MQDEHILPKLTFEKLQAQQNFARVLSESPSIRSAVVAGRRPLETTVGLCHQHVPKLSDLSITLTRLPLRLHLKERELRTRVSLPPLIDNFWMPRSRPVAVPSYRVFKRALGSEGAFWSYETDLMLPSSSPARNRGIVFLSRWSNFELPWLCYILFMIRLTMDLPLKDLAKLRTVTEGTSKGRNPSIEYSLDSLLQTLHQVRSRLEAGTTTEDTFALLAQTVEAKKKEVDEKQKEIYNAIARVGKSLDKVRTCVFCLRVGMMLYS